MYDLVESAAFNGCVTFALVRIYINLDNKEG